MWNKTEIVMDGIIALLIGILLLVFIYSSVKLVNQIVQINLIQYEEIFR